MEPVWYQEIRELHDRHFHDDWQERVCTINQQYGLSGDFKLRSHGRGVPMPWFNGDIQAVEPGQWVLVVSLNHQAKADPNEASIRPVGEAITKDAAWHERRTFNRDNWYGTFFGPLARVAAAVLQVRLPKEEEPTFASTRMIFVEICPYGSNRFNLEWSTVEELLKNDPGFQLAAKVNRLLIERGKPALVMVNGNRAIDLFNHLYAPGLYWQEVHYGSCHPAREGGKRKQLRHLCGSLQSGTVTVPIVGFPFLRTRSTHNSNQEIALLGDHALQCFRTYSHAPSTEAPSPIPDGRGGWG